MKKNITVLDNLLSHFPRSDFEKSVQSLGGDHRIRTLSCFELLKTLIYAQVTGAFSVREITSSLAAHSSKLYHQGLQATKRSTLCDALEKRNPEIFEQAFNALVNQAKILSGKNGRRFKLPLKIIDATTIELCISRFDWAKFRSTKGAVKLHLAMDGDHLFPQQIKLTNGAIHEVKELAPLSNESAQIYVMDRGYVHFKALHEIHLSDSFFVTRMKDNCQFELLRPLSVSLTGAIRFDAIVRLTSSKAKEDYPAELRRINYHDAETNRDYVFMTNSITLCAQEIADIYKARWQVELFFKWIKQNLKIKTFWGTSRNAVFTQIWVAMIVYMLLWIAKFIDAISSSCQRILQLMKTTLFDKRSLNNLFESPAPPGRNLTTQLYFVGLKN